MNILFMGSPAFAAPTLQAITRNQEHNVSVITQSDKPAKRGYHQTPPIIKLMAQRLRLPVYQPFSLNTTEGIALVKKLEPDLIVVVAFGQILPDEILSIPPLGCINLHPSLLPKYRGAAPIQWSLINGDEKTGITVAYITSKLDSGDIILQSEASIENFDTGASLSDKLSSSGAVLVMEAICLIKDGNVPRIPQDETRASYAPKIRHEDTLIDWQQPAGNIFNLVRALNAVPGAYTSVGSERLKILTTEIVDVCVFKEPGTVVDITRMGPIVSTQDKGLLLLEVHPQAKKPMSGYQFLQGHRWGIGMRLG
ncbi:MAG: methionyl-tRNA formyltransferase [bacterium]|nr:methionyl-tRNA formyltransferase [bacterium]